MSKPKIMVVEDDRGTRDGLVSFLAADYQVEAADNAEKALAKILDDQDYDLVLTDLKMPGLDGVSFIRQVNQLENPPGCILLTAYGSPDVARAARQAGAVMYLQKPLDLDYTEIIVSWFVELRRLKFENQELKRELAAQKTFAEMIGKSAVIQRIQDTIKQIAPARSTVLITGESGTGKELAARALHDLSPRARNPFVVVHCAALAPALLASELFGHEKGAFTSALQRHIGRFETAAGGTVFLDEISEIDPTVQVTLLRFLENRTFERVGGTQPLQVDVRLVAATNRDLRQMVAEGKFREDLYYRLDVIHLQMPALRERRDDIPLLLKYFLDALNRENNKDIAGYEPAATDVLVAYDWPGNVRELRNCVERMVVLSRGGPLALADVPAHIRSTVTGLRQPTLAGGDSLDLGLHEQQVILRAVAECRGNKVAAARKLGISRRTLYRKLAGYGQ